LRHFQLFVKKPVYAAKLTFEAFILFINYGMLDIFAGSPDY